MCDPFRFLMVLFSVVSLSACYDAGSYRGDGQLVDKGRQAAKDRYVLTLGEIDIGEPDEFESHLVGLPSEYFFVGLEIELAGLEREAYLESKLPCNPQVRIEIQDLSNNVMTLDVGGYLTSDWVWSTSVGDPVAFVYIRNSPFRPKSLQSRYEMTVRVGNLPERSCYLQAALVAKSPGWK